MRHKGRFWDVEFPQLRPQPFQKPHPPLVRACISEASTLAMGRIGRPILMGVQEPEVFVSRMIGYRDEMAKSGFDEDTIETTLDQCWFSKNVFVAETYERARELCEPGFHRERKHFREAREIYNPEGFPPLDPDQAPARWRGFREGVHHRDAGAGCGADSRTACRRCAQPDDEDEHRRDGHGRRPGLHTAIW